MKRKLLILGVALILAGTNSTFAECTKATNTCPIKDLNTKNKIHSCNCVKERSFKKHHQYFLQKAKRYQDYVRKIQNERATVYNALNLSDEQIKMREDILKENSHLYDKKFDELSKESFKLDALKNAGASSQEISRQKKVIDGINKDIENLLNQENKLYKKCLTREQRSKYSMIKKLEKNEYKQTSHQKDYYKSNPKMVPFGNPTKDLPCCQDKENAICPQKCPSVEK